MTNEDNRCDVTLTSSEQGLTAEGKRDEEQPRFAAQLKATLNVIPAYTWYAAPSGGLTFVNKRTADYLGLPKDHPLRFGIDIGAQWDAHITLLHPDDREEARKYWSNLLRTGEAGEHSYRVRSARTGAECAPLPTETLPAPAIGSRNVSRGDRFSSLVSRRNGELRCL